MVSVQLGGDKLAIWMRWFNWALVCKQPALMNSLDSFILFLQLVGI